MIRTRNMVVAVLAAVALVFTGASTAGASGASTTTAETVDFYISGPNVLNTYAPGAVIETFNGFTPGQACPNTWPTLGTITVSGSGNGCLIKNADVFGGATRGANSNPVTRPSGSGTPYVSVERNSTVTLSLAQSETYLGFWWSAGDAANSIKLYTGGTGGKLVGSFSTASLVAMLNGGTGTVSALNGSSYATCNYYGNPVLTTSTCGGGREPFAYVHLIANGGLNFDTVVFTQGGSGNFEIDNMAVSRFVTPAQNLISFPPDLQPGHSAQAATTCSPFVSNLDWTASNFATTPTYTVTPALSADFTFDAQSGEFAGTPTATLSSTTYTVTATAGSQSKQSSFTLSVTGSTPCPPPSPFLVASNSPLISDTCGPYTSGLEWIAADFTSEPTYSIAPSLPSEFTFNSSTGEFSGTPTNALALSTYTVTATAGAEQATGTFEFSVIVMACPSPDPSPLPDTGTSSGNWTWFALGMVGLGVAIVSTTRRGRRR